MHLDNHMLYCKACKCYRQSTKSCRLAHSRFAAWSRYLGQGRWVAHHTINDFKK